MVGVSLKWLRGLAAVLALLSATAQAAPPDPVSIAGAWARLSTRPHVLFVYLTISLAKGTDDVLVGASSPIAAKVDLLAPLAKGAGKRESLEPVLALELDNHAPTVLQPGEAHLILRGVKQRPRPGDSFPLTLRFGTAGSREITVKVLAAPPGDGMPTLPKDIKLD